MGKLVIGLIVGLVVGAGGALFLGGGAMMGAGVGTGLSAGMCSVLNAAIDAEIMTPEQADEVLASAARQLGGLSDDEAVDIVGSAAACDGVLQRIREAA